MASVFIIFHSSSGDKYIILFGLDVLLTAECVHPLVSVGEPGGCGRTCFNMLKPQR